MEIKWNEKREYMEMNLYRNNMNNIIIIMILYYYCNDIL